jgi:hypothetical protein
VGGVGLAMRPPKLRGALLLVATTVSLGACAVVDQYSERAVVYNVQAEQAQNQALLLNIVRASMRRPMQFTTVSSITGTAVATGGTQYTLPVNVPFRPITNGASIATFPALPTWNFTGSMSGGPAFSVPVLDTQEFYQGILKPIPGQLYDLYIQAGYPQDLLFNLFVKKISMVRVDDHCKNTHLRECEFTFDNYVSNNFELRLFQALADDLLTLGLTTEAVAGPKVKFDNPQNVNVRYVGAPVRVAGQNQKDEFAEVVAPPGGSAAAASEAAPKQYGICFKPHSITDADCVGGPESPELCGIEKKTELTDRQLKCTASNASIYASTFFGKKNPYHRLKFSLSGETEGAATVQTSGTPKIKVIIPERSAKGFKRVAEEEIRLHPELLQGHPEMATLADRLYGFADQPVLLTFTLRSTEGMIYYVGELARRQLSPEYGAEGPIFVKAGPPSADYPKVSCQEPKDGCWYLFVIKDGVPAPTDFVSVNYAGQWFSVPGGPDTGFTSQVLDILRQQIAVNSSAKSLPQSSVISLVGGQ